MRCKALLVEFCSARHLQGSLQGTCKAVCKAVLVVKSCANISSCFLAISLCSHWLPLAQPLLTARLLQGILHGTCAWQNLEADFLVFFRAFAGRSHRSKVFKFSVSTYAPHVAWLFFKVSRKLSSELCIRDFSSST